VISSSIIRRTGVYARKNYTKKPLRVRSGLNVYALFNIVDEILKF
jgi:hypothetical protein